MAYYNGSLIVADGSGGHLLRVNPDGTSQVFASIPISQTGLSVVKGAMTLNASEAADFGGALLVTVFNQDSTNDSVFIVSADGKTVTPIASGLLEPFADFPAQGPGGAFGSNIFIPQNGRVCDRNPGGRCSIRC